LNGEKIMSEELNSVNAEQDGAVDQPQEVTETTEQPTEQAVNADDNGEVATPAVEEDKVPQTPAENKNYADIRRRASTEAQDRTISEMNLSWNDKPITTYSDYQKALQEQKWQKEAEEKGQDPELYSKVNNMQSELSSLRRDKTLSEQDSQLSNDPKVGEIYKQYKPETHKIASDYNVDYNTALTILIRENLSDIMGKKSIQTEQDTIKGLQQNSNTSPGSLGNGSFNKANIGKMDKKSFAELTQQAIRGELKNF